MNTLLSMNDIKEKKIAQLTPQELQSKQAEIQGVGDPEEKIKKTIELMEGALSQEGHPCFKTFWDAREQALQLFKENIPPSARAIYWEQYRELTKQARLLKEHLEEESSFAVEQIEIALVALENEINNIPELVNNLGFEDFPRHSLALQGNLENYLNTQKKLILLNACASRINSLRKELANTKMRLRKKSVFFDRLSKAGHQIFPARKALIEELSQLFGQDVEEFITKNCKKLPDRQLHHLREEIKQLQAAAKLLSINSHTFSTTRAKLSECWDSVKEAEKEQKKFYAEKRETTKKNMEELNTQIQDVVAQFTSGSISPQEMQTQLDEISKKMKAVELSRDEVFALKDALSQAKKPLLERYKEEEKKKRQKELEKEEKKQGRIRDIEEAIVTITQQCKEMESKDLFEKLSGIKSQIHTLSLSTFEKESLLRSLLPVEDVAFGKNDQEFDLPTDPEEARKVLKEALASKQVRRATIKEQMEKYRKQCGSSGLDFEKSMHYNQQLALEKERFEKISDEISRLEFKLAKL